MTIDPQDVTVGILARHHSGRVYRVLHIANASTPETDKFPHCVVYQNVHDDTVWTRPLREWAEKFDLLPPSLPCKGLEVTPDDQERLWLETYDDGRCIELAGSSGGGYFLGSCGEVTLFFPDPDGNITAQTYRSVGAGCEVVRRHPAPSLKAEEVS